jgi:hypothetical protein
MARTRDKKREEVKRMKRRVGMVAKRTLATDLKEDLGAYHDKILTEDISVIDIIDEEGESLVEALLTNQGSTPIPKGKKKRSYNDFEDEDEDEYHEQYSGSASSTPKKPQEGPSRSNVSIPGQSLLD